MQRPPILWAAGGIARNMCSPIDMQTFPRILLHLPITSLSNSDFSYRVVFLFLPTVIKCVDLTSNCWAAVSGAITESTNDCVNAVCKSVQYHIRALRHIRPSISEDVAKMVSSVLADYAKSFLFGTTPKSISKLQKAQNYLARVIARSSRSCCSHSSSGSPLVSLSAAQLCMLVILLVLSESQTLICCAIPLYAVYLASAISALHSPWNLELSSFSYQNMYQSWFFPSPQNPLFQQGPSNSFNVFLIASQLRLLLTIVHVYLLARNAMSRTFLTFCFLFNLFCTTRWRHNRIIFRT